MEDKDQIVALLERIEQNQQKAMQLQEQQVSFAKAQLDRTEGTIRESIQLQRLSVARQTQIRNVALPLIVILMAVVGYLLIKWRL